MRTKSKMPVTIAKPQGVKRVQFKESTSTCKKKPRRSAAVSEVEEGEIVSLEDAGSQNQEIIPDSQESSIDAGKSEEPTTSCEEPDEAPVRTLSEAEYEVNSQAWPETDSSQDPGIYENDGVFVSVSVDRSGGVSRTYSDVELNDMQTLPC